MDIVRAPRTIWFFSDPHFDHASLVHGSANHTTPSRSEFTSVGQMNEAIISNLHERVKPSDHLYCLGDFAMGHEGVERWANRLPGHTRLILGNHDVKEAAFYLRFFNKVMAYREFDGMMFSHIPIAPWSMRWRANVHGHCHVAKPLFYSCSDPELVGFGRKVQYINISVEHTKYRPVSLETIGKWSRQ